MTDSPDGPVLDRQLLVQMVLGIVGLIAVAAALALLMEEPITAMAEAFIDRFGLLGIFAGVMLTDTSPVPLTHEPVLLLGVSAGVETMTLWAVAASASVLSGIVGYGLGFALVSRSRLRGWVDRKHPGFIRFMERHGHKGVAVAALLPIPFAVATWSAGMTRIGLGGVALASLLRIPKAGFYLWLIVTGWGFGGG